MECHSGYDGREGEGREGLGSWRDMYKEIPGVSDTRRFGNEVTGEGK